jgi:nitrate reductase alpha subunit
MYIHTRVNPLRRWALPQVAERNLWPKFELIVGMNLRMTTTTMKSDIVLPAAGYYEQRNIKYAQSYVPYLVVGDKAVEALGESRTEWDVWGEVAKILERKAKERGVGPVIDGREVKRDYTKLYDEWTHGHMFTHENDDKFYEVVTAKSPEVGHVSWDEAVTKGAVPIKKLPEFRTHTNFCSDWEPGDTVYSCQWFTELKKPWPTLTGRQQFYLDHPWFIAADEHLPIHKEPPMIGGDYPMLLTGGHTRWSIHSTWRDEKHMLRLQRGEPSAWIGVDDAETRGISDGDRIRIFNDEGTFQLIAKVSPSVQPGQVIVYHAWEPLQFKDWKGQQEPVSSTWKSLHLAEYGQLHYRFVYGGPHHAPRAMTVEVERV